MSPSTSSTGMAAWVRYIGPTRHPLRHNQVILMLNPIENDPDGRSACVVLVGVNNSSVCALKSQDLRAMTASEVATCTPEDYQGGLR
jgi:hypothetical protein